MCLLPPLPSPPLSSLSTRIDTMLEETLDLKGIPSSQIPGRPKKWRSKCMEILDTSIANKYVSSVAAKLCEIQWHSYC